MAKRKTIKQPAAEPERKESLKALPPNIRNSLTEEELEAFLYKNEWPESLFEKLSEFIVPPDDGQ